MCGLDIPWTYCNFILLSFSLSLTSSKTSEPHRLLSCFLIAPKLPVVRVRCYMRPYVSENTFVTSQDGGSISLRGKTQTGRDEMGKEGKAERMNPEVRELNIINRRLLSCLSLRGTVRHSHRKYRTRHQPLPFTRFLFVCFYRMS